ncbi:hypothetical protein PGB90_003144 [Kerria lacca]
MCNTWMAQVSHMMELGADGRNNCELGSQPLPTVSPHEESESAKEQRQRAGTWSQTRGHTIHGHSIPPQLVKAIRSKTLSRERRKSDEELSPKIGKNKSSQSPSRKSGGLFFDAFRPRSKSDATSKSKKSTNLISQMRNAVQNSLMSPSSSGRSSASGSTSSSEADPVRTRGLPLTETGRYRHVSESSRPRAVSDSVNNKGPVSKVMDLFRHRSNSAVSAEEKRRARAVNAYHHHDIPSHGALLRRGSLDPDRRRLSLGTVPHRGSDVGLDPNHAAILFRDSRGLPVADPFLEKVNLSDLEEDESQIFVKFFRFHKCYDLIPTSAKLVVFDTQLLVKKAFFALVDNGVRAAPLWDSVKQQFVGMLTITDFIKILQKYYTSSNVTMDELEEHKLETWKKALPDQHFGMISIGPDVSLYEAIRVLIHKRIHRLPVIDPYTGNVLYILTHKRILRFLFLYINDLPKPSYMNKTISDLKIGTYDNIETVIEDTTIILALKKFVERRVSALPVVDEKGRLVDIFAKFDVINLAAQRTYNNLDITLKKANEHRNEWFEGVHRCHLTDTLYSVLEKIVRAEVHRLVIVDKDEKVIGIISLSDLLVYLVLRPCGDHKIKNEVETDGVEESESETPSLIIADEIDAPSSSQLVPPANESACWREVTVSGGE